ncbi:hypothetical protein GCM10025771_36880 [Niveibacterium umoris]|uniref:Copper chaperone n=1 Tax=Niveibacterium umoris TaxID=1193620 RepID=A0A840BFZ4_9RHOO|nr:heavy metal-associated domain-containing protein [Niveibacterium umoris]MBB4011114.1 copper chaperone [Niveibacterium umoris]
METVTFKVSGMSCQGCVGSVERVLKAQEGVATAIVSLDAAQATVEFDPDRVSLPVLQAAVRGAGFETD